MRAGGCEAWPIKIIEMAGKTLEHTLVKTDPFNGNQCTDSKCLPNKNENNKINCRRNCICYKITCKLCLKAGRSGDMSATYYGESGKNMHCRAKEHLSKFNSKKEHIRKESAFIKHLENSHGGGSQDLAFSDYFDIVILKAYKKPFTKCVEEGTYIASHKGEVLNSKSEWHQAKIIRTTTRVMQGGAEVLRQQEGGVGQQQEGGARQQEGGAGQWGRQAGGQAGQGREEQRPRGPRQRTTRRSRG